MQSHICDCLEGKKPHFFKLEGENNQTSFAAREGNHMCTEQSLASRRTWSTREQRNCLAGWMSQCIRGRSQQRRETGKQRKLSLPQCCTKTATQPQRIYPKKRPNLRKDFMPGSCCPYQVKSAQTSALLSLLQLQIHGVPSWPADWEPCDTSVPISWGPWGTQHLPGQGTSLQEDAFYPHRAWDLSL